MKFAAVAALAFLASVRAECQEALEIVESNEIQLASVVPGPYTVQTIVLGGESAYLMTHGAAVIVNQYARTTLSEAEVACAKIGANLGFPDFNNLNVFPGGVVSSFTTPFVSQLQLAIESVLFNTVWVNLCNGAPHIRQYIQTPSTTVDTGSDLFPQEDLNECLANALRPGSVLAWPNKVDYSWNLKYKFGYVCQPKISVPSAYDDVTKFEGYNADQVAPFSPNDCDLIKCVNVNGACSAF